MLSRHGFEIALAGLFDQALTTQRMGKDDMVMFLW
jgi:hypothetical protein